MHLVVYDQVRECCAAAGLSWTATSRVSFHQFTALTSLIWSDLGKWFNDCFSTVFQHCVGGWSDVGMDTKLMYGTVN